MLSVKNRKEELLRNDLCFIARHFLLLSTRRRCRSSLFLRLVQVRERASPIGDGYSDAPIPSDGALRRTEPAVERYGVPETDSSESDYTIELSDDSDSLDGSCKAPVKARVGLTDK